MTANKDTKNNSSIKNKSAKIIKDMEDAGETILKELSEQYGKVRSKVTEYAHSAANTTAAVTEKVTSQETRDRLSELAEDVEAAGEKILQQMNERITDLRNRVAASIDGFRSPPQKKSPRKKVSKKKAVKKKVTKKKTANKKVTQKKAPVKKKTKKKTVARKKR